jgi:hypothetical protein
VTKKEMFVVNQSWRFLKTTNVMIKSFPTERAVLNIFDLRVTAEPVEVLPLFHQRPPVRIGMSEEEEVDELPVRGDQLIGNLARNFGAVVETEKSFFFLIANLLRQLILWPGWAQARAQHLSSGFYYINQKPKPKWA